MPTHQLLLLWWEGCGGRFLCMLVYHANLQEHTRITFKNGIEVGDLTKKKKKVHLYSNENYSVNKHFNSVNTAGEQASPLQCVKMRSEGFVINDTGQQPWLMGSGSNLTPSKGWRFQILARPGT